MTTCQSSHATDEMPGAEGTVPSRGRYATTGQDGGAEREIVRASYVAWNAGDMNAWAALFDPSVIMTNPEDWPEPGPQVGREAVMRYIQQLRDTWDGDALDPIGDFVDGADRVVVRFIWRTAGQGPQADIELTGVYTVRKVSIIGMEYFWDHAEALETLGLAAQ